MERLHPSAATWAIHILVPLNMTQDMGNWGVRNNGNISKWHDFDPRGSGMQYTLLSMLHQLWFFYDSGPRWVDCWRMEVQPPTGVPFSLRVSEVYRERGFIGWTLPGWDPLVLGLRGLLAHRGLHWGCQPRLGLQALPSLHLPPVFSPTLFSLNSCLSLATLRVLKYT